MIVWKYMGVIGNLALEKCREEVKFAVGPNILLSLSTSLVCLRKRWLKVSRKINLREEGGVRGQKKFDHCFFWPRKPIWSQPFVVIYNCWWFLNLGDDSSGTPKSQKCVFLKTLSFLNKSVYIRNLTINYVVPEYIVRFGVNFDNFGWTMFAKNRILFLKFWINFSIDLRRETNSKKWRIFNVLF